jgi:hypothetical protein
MASYYVDNDVGDDGDGGGVGDPWETIAHAIGAIGAGDVINIVNTGIDYTEHPTITDDYSGDPATIQGANPADPPTVNTGAGGPWQFNGADGWIIQDLIFEGWSTYYGGIRLGDTECTDIHIEQCWFRYATGHGITVTSGGVDGLYVGYCHFRDIRSRSGTANRNGITNWGTWNDVTIEWCTFEDLGSDGVHIHSSTTNTNIVIQDCGFFVNRSATGNYGADGTSLYNGDATTWQDYNDNVSEEGNDFWQVEAGEDVTVRRCFFSGFWPVEVGQDASANHYGYGVIYQYDSSDAIQLSRCLFYDNHFGIIFSYGSGTAAGGNADKCFIHNSDDDGVWTGGGDASLDVTITDCTIIDSVDDSIDLSWSRVADISGNICEEAPEDGGNNTDEDNINYN